MLKGDSLVDLDDSSVGEGSTVEALKDAVGVLDATLLGAVSRRLGSEHEANEGDEEDHALDRDRELPSRRPSDVGCVKSGVSAVVRERASRGRDGPKP